jgi:DNA primase
MVSGRIPKEFIDQLLARVDIVEIIDERLPLKKAGNVYKALCPFHDERTPSFTVSPNKQFYHCFGCSASGNAITFLREFSHLSFEESLEDLATTAGLELPQSHGLQSKNTDVQQLLEVLAHTNQWFKEQLRQHNDSHTAVSYLKKRKISGKMAAHFELGLAPGGWDNLAKTVEGKPERLALLVKAGLLATHDTRGHYDRFRSRIIFPIHDGRGRVIGFGGRILGDDKPKYLNSPETPVFHKGAELYNLHRARSAIANEGYSLVVEGYTDIVSLTQEGIKNTVATLGTATTPIHLKYLFRLAPHIVFCFDGDRAGRQAAWKALEIALTEMVGGRQASFLFLSEGEDPDSLIQNSGADSFLQKVKNATPLPDFLFDTIVQGVDLERIDGLARLAEITQPLLDKIPLGPFRELMQGRLKQLSGVGHPTPRLTSPRKSAAKKSDQRLSPIATAVSLLVQNPSLAHDMALPVLEIIDNEATERGVTLLIEIHEIARTNPNISSPAIVERFRDQENFRFLEKLAVWDHLVDETNLKSFYEETIDTVEERMVNTCINVLLGRSATSKLDGISKAKLSSLYARRETLRSKRGRP